MPVYVKQTWSDGPAGATPLSAARLQYIEDGIAAVEAALTAQNYVEIAYAENVTGTVTSASSAGGQGTAVDVPGVAITIPAGSRPVWLKWEGTYSVTTAVTAAVAYLRLVETTSGTTTICQADSPMPNSATTFGGAGDLSRSYRLGVVSGTRTFKLQFVIGTPAGVTAAANLANAAVAPTFLMAESR